MEVRVYRNLTRKCWSIQHKTPNGWRLYRHANSLELLNVSVKIYDSARLRGLNEKKKYVHAYLIGELNESPYGRIDEPVDSQWVIYRPIDGYFRKKDYTAFLSSELVLLDHSGSVFYDCKPVNKHDLFRKINPLDHKIGE